MCAAPFAIDPGQGQGRVYHCHDGFSYHRNNEVASHQFLTIYLRCVKFETLPCLGRAIIYVTPNEQRWVDTQEHTCRAHNYASQCRHFRREVLQACRHDLYVTPRQLFNSISERYHPAVVERFGGSYLRSPMRNARIQQYPNAPFTLQELGMLLESPQYQHLTATIGGEDSVYGGVIGYPGRECVLFLSRRMAKYLCQLREAFADATFVSAPLIPAAAQVYQIVGLAHNNVIPLAQILMPNKEYLTYKGMLNGLRRRVPRFRPRKMHMDYEQGPIKAWKEEYGVIIRGCYFHYVKAVLKKVRKLGLSRLLRNNREVRSVLRSFLGIPLLPHDMMHCGLFVLIRRALRLGSLHALLPFLSYYIDTWMVGFRYETLSVYSEHNRTSNALEAAQRVLRRETGPHHPNIWHFINAIRRYEWSAYISSRRAVRGLSVGRRQKLSTLRNDRVIRNYMEDLLAGNVTTWRFLRNVSTRVLGVFHGTLRLQGLL